MKRAANCRMAILALLSVSVTIGRAKAETVILAIDASGAPVADATVYIDTAGKSKQLVTTGNTDSSGQFKCTLDENVFSYALTGHDESGRVGGESIKKTRGSWNGTYQLKLLNLRAEVPIQPTVPTATIGVPYRVLGMVQFCECGVMKWHEVRQPLIQVDASANPCGCIGNATQPDFAPITASPGTTTIVRMLPAGQ